MRQDRKLGEYDLCVIGGCGHIGLPLGLAFASRGQRVVLYDINQHAVARVNKKVIPFLEEGAPELLIQMVEEKMLCATTDPEVISQADNLVIVIGTPVDEHLNPRLQDVMNTIHQILAYIQDGHLIILRSTIYPGVTEKIDAYLKDQGKKVEVAFCPERVAEGQALKEVASLPQIVSGCSEQAVQRATDVFSLLTRNIVHLSPIEAELAKLFTNTWRYINFAISNQFYMIADSHGVDFYKIYHGMTQGYPRLRGFAKAGFTAGPCLFKDTMQLSAFSNNNFFLGHAAMLINEGLPNYIVTQLKLRYPLREKVVGILGMAFKGDSDDPRESLSYKLKKVLELEARRVLCSDVYISGPGFVSAEDLVKQAEIIILGAPHREYKTLVPNGKPVVDIWDFLSDVEKL